MKKFKKIYIEITNRCNLSCSFCQPSRRPMAFMPLVSFSEILQKISGHTEHISLHVLGEAFLHPDLGLILTASHAFGLRVNLSTNGILLARNQSMLLHQPALRQINISLHSFEQSTPQGALDSYLDPILDFLTAAVSHPHLIINLRIWNLQHPAAIGAQSLNSRMLSRLEKHFGLPGPISGEVPAERGIMLAPRIFLSRKNLFVWPHAPSPDKGVRGFCRGLRDHVAILVDGTVLPCCLDAEGDIPLGNIFQSTLSEILAVPRAVMIREGFSRQQIVDPLCRRCTYRQRFQKNIAKEPGSVNWQELSTVVQPELNIKQN